MRVSPRMLRGGFAALLACWGVAILVESRSLPASDATPADVGPGFVPLTVAALLVALACVEVQQCLKERALDGAVDRGSPPAARSQLLYLGAVVGSAVLTFLIGPIVAVVALVFWSMKVVERRSWTQSTITTAVLVGSLYIVFSTLLNIRLPLLPV
jgi:hypothetical protein